MPSAIIPGESMDLVNNHDLYAMEEGFGVDLPGDEHRLK